MLHWNILESDVPRERNTEDVTWKISILVRYPKKVNIPDCVCYICCYGLNFLGSLYYDGIYTLGVSHWRL